MTTNTTRRARSPATGELDQNETEHAYHYDRLGRLLTDTATVNDPSADDAIGTGALGDPDNERKHLTVAHRIWRDGSELENTILNDFLEPWWPALVRGHVLLARTHLITKI